MQQLLPSMILQQILIFTYIEIVNWLGTSEAFTAIRECLPGGMANPRSVIMGTSFCGCRNIWKQNLEYSRIYLNFTILNLSLRITKYLIMIAGDLGYL